VDIALLGSTEATWQKYFELTTDLDFSKDETVTSSMIDAFYGTFDGKGHVIKDLNIDVTGKLNISIFHSLSYGEIKNLGREGGRIFDLGTTPTAIVAGIVLTSKGKLSNCYNSSSIENTYRGGGLVYEMNDGGIIENCYNTGDIAVNVRSGGLVGSVLFGGGIVSIKNSYNFGNVILSDQYAGGLIGVINNATGNDQTLNMNNCFNFGKIVIGANIDRVGSILGLFNSSSNINATRVYSRPDVAFANNGEVPKSNQPIGWLSTAQESLKNAILLANPAMGENDRYSLEYSQTPAFAAELGDAFKHAPGRTPKLAWEN
jgi:hypothetical protein